MAMIKHMLARCCCAEELPTIIVGSWTGYILQFIHENPAFDPDIGLLDQEALEGSTVEYIPPWCRKDSQSFINLSNNPDQQRNEFWVRAHASITFGGEIADLTRVSLFFEQVENENIDPMPVNVRYSPPPFGDTLHRGAFQGPFASGNIFDNTTSEIEVTDVFKFGAVPTFNGFTNEGLFIEPDIDFPPYPPIPPEPPQFAETRVGAGWQLEAIGIISMPVGIRTT